MTLRVENLSLSVADRTLVEGLSFTAEPGRLLAIMGPSGCGKSSILDYLCGTLSSSYGSFGSIYLAERDISELPAHRRKIALQLQDHLMFPHLTVGENLAFGLPRHYKRKERKERVLQALEGCQLAGSENQNPATLSGGQRARVSLMRTLLSEPDALLLDEPFSKLDPELRAQFRTFVFQQVDQLSIPVIMVTHDQQDIPSGADVLRLS